MHRAVAGVFLWFIVMSAPLAGDQVTLVASIKPLALLASQLVDGCEVDVETLLPAHVSEHGYALKVSDIEALQQARLVIWMGVELEPYLAASRDRWLDHSNASKSLALMEEGAATHETHPGHTHHHGDPHRWLDPQQTIGLAQAIAVRLKHILPGHSERIDSNLEQLMQEVNDLDRRWRHTFEPYKTRPFVVFHDAYADWAKHYGFRQLGVIYSSAGSLRGVKQLADLQEKINNEQAQVCLFVEPQLGDARVPKALTATNKLRRQMLDPLGGGAGSYVELMETLNQGALACFAGKR